MTEPSLDVLDPELRSAFEEKGYTSLTAVQAAVLDPSARGRDLRITSQTGSGKTIAIGFVLREFASRPSPPGPTRAARPRALVITPTRELGRQVEDELRWLYAPLGVKLTAVTGGASYRDEHRALAAGPALVVATPGRLIDHLEHGSLDPSAIEAVVLDEADRMLDMGFAEALANILSRVPEGRRTHLVSATFPSEVRHLADRVQVKALHVEGTRLGAANVDIEHLLVLCDGHQRIDALVNLLLVHGDARTLVFTRTRAGVNELTELLDEAGFTVAAISGELAQAQRTRALSAFKKGSLRILVATDVAARGIDVSDIMLVVHVEPPADPDAYTHRAGRTGRAGKKGTSAVLVAPRELARAERVVARANVRFQIVPVPTPGAIRAREDDRIVARLTEEDGLEIDPRTLALAERITARGEVERTLGRLLMLGGLTRGPEAREVRVLAVPGERRAPPPKPARGARPQITGPRAPVTELPPPPASSGERFVPFQISLGSRQSAEPRRLLAMMCRRGEIESRDVGAIRIGEASSIIEVREHVADRFHELTMRPDPRDPAVRVRPALTGRPTGPRPFPMPRAGGGEPPQRHAGRARDADPPQRHANSAPDGEPPQRHAGPSAGDPRRRHAGAPGAEPPRRHAGATPYRAARPRAHEGGTDAPRPRRRP